MDKIIENYYLIRIKECELNIQIYDELFHFASEKNDFDLAESYSKEITYWIKSKLEYIEKLEGNE